MKRILRAFIAGTGEENEAKQDFFHLYGNLPKWPEPHNTLRKFIERTYMKYGVPTLLTIKNDVKASNREDLKELVGEIEGLLRPTEAELAQAVIETSQDILVENWKEVVSDQSEILLSGKKVGGKDKRGLKDAIRHILSGAMSILSQLSPEQRTSTLQEDMEEMRRWYIKVRDNPQQAYGMPWGIKQLDDATNGIFPGELGVIAAYAGEGKTTTLMNVLYNQIIVYGFNGFLWSGEMSKNQIWRMLSCIHAVKMDWGEDVPVVEYDAVKKGRLDKKAEDFLLNVLLPDIRDNPKYGKLYIEPSDIDYPTLDTLRTKAEVINQLDPLDMIYIDYDGLLYPSEREKYGTHLSEFNAIIKNMKQAAKTFDQGRKIGILTCHQTNRKGKEEADKKEGVYTMQALSDCNEVERSSDHIFTSWQSPAASLRNEARITHLKGRDSPIIPPFYVYVDKGKRFVGNMQTEDGTGTSIVDV